MRNISDFVLFVVIVKYTVYCGCHRRIILFNVLDIPRSVEYREKV